MHIHLAVTASFWVWSYCFPSIPYFYWNVNRTPSRTYYISMITKNSSIASKDWTMNSMSKHYFANRIESLIYLIFHLQWLVKRAIETREVLGDKIRAYSISQFNKNYHLPLDDQMKAKHPRSVEAINTCKVRALFFLSCIAYNTMILESCSNKCSLSPTEAFLPNFLVRCFIYEFWKADAEIIFYLDKI